MLEFSWCQFVSWPYTSIQSVSMLPSFWPVMYLHTTYVKHHNWSLDLKLSPCSECCRLILRNSPASAIYMPTFRNTLSVPSSSAGRFRMTRFEKCNTYPNISQTYSFYTYLLMKMEQTVGSETSVYKYKIQTPGNYPEESVQ